MWTLTLTLSPISGSALRDRQIAATERVGLHQQQDPATGDL